MDGVRRRRGGVFDGAVAGCLARRRPGVRRPGVGRCASAACASGSPTVRGARARRLRGSGPIIVAVAVAVDAAVDAAVSRRLTSRPPSRSEQGPGHRQAVRAGGERAGTARASLVRGNGPQRMARKGVARRHVRCTKDYRESSGVSWELVGSLDDCRVTDAAVAGIPDGKARCRSQRRPVLGSETVSQHLLRHTDRLCQKTRRYLLTGSPDSPASRRASRPSARSAISASTGSSPTCRRISGPPFHGVVVRICPSWPATIKLS